MRAVARFSNHSSLLCSSVRSLTACEGRGMRVSTRAGGGVRHAAAQLRRPLSRGPRGRHLA